MTKPNASKTGAPQAEAPKTQKRGMSGLLYAAICLIVGVAVFAGSYVILTGRALQNAADTAQSAVLFVRQSVQSHEESASSSKTKSLTEVWEKVIELDDRYDILQDGQKNLSTVSDYLEKMNLDAVFLLDGERNVVMSEGDKDAVKAVASAAQDSEHLDDIDTYKVKSYLSRITVDGHTYDCASCASGVYDGAIVVGVNRVEEGDLSNDAAIFSSLFSNYSFGLDGSIAVLDDSSVVASNNDDVLGMARESFNVQLAYTESVKNALMKGEYGGKTCYGVKTESNGYDVYVWFTGQSVMEARNAQLASGFILYLLAILVITVVRVNMQNSKLRRERECTEKLERANMAKTDFLRRMSHDVRTPINGIRGMLAIGDHYAQDMQKQAECRSKMWEASSFLLELVNSALDMNKLESGEMQFEHKPFDLCQATRSVVDILQIQAQNAGIELEFESDVEHCRLLGSPLHLRQVLQNIGGNAIKYNKDGGSARIECHELGVENDRVKIRVTCEDTGVGMSEEFQKRAFEAFAQEDSNPRTVYQGTGLGLAISKEIVEQMGGTIKLESTKGKGTKFTIELEFDIDADARPAGEGDAPVDAAALKGMRVLLAEDNELNSEVATFMLEQEGIAVETAQNGQEALERFAQSQPGHYDMILMDVMMPVMDGYEASRAIRLLERPDAKVIPIIAVTANAFTDDQKISASSGMNAHISKPLDAKKLIRVINENRL